MMTPPVNKQQVSQRLRSAALFFGAQGRVFIVKFTWKLSRSFLSAILTSQRTSCTDEIPQSSVGIY